MADLADQEMIDFNVEDGFQKATQAIHWDKVDSKIQESRAFSQEWLIKSIADLTRQETQDA